MPKYVISYISGQKYPSVVLHYILSLTRNQIPSIYGYYTTCHPSL